jgi:hypothetical protein
MTCGLGGACGGIGRSADLLQLDKAQASRRIDNGFLPPDRNRDGRSFILFIAALSNQAFIMHFQEHRIGEGDAVFLIGLFVMRRVQLVTMQTACLSGIRFATAADRSSIRF